VSIDVMHSNTIPTLTRPSYDGVLTHSSLLIVGHRELGDFKRSDIQAITAVKVLSVSENATIVH
jgi:hypothetical protein